MASRVPEKASPVDAGDVVSTGDADLRRVLLVKAKGGLGNRILSAVTGCVYARLHGRQPCIDWRDGAYVPEGVNLYPLLFDAQHSGDPALYDGADIAAPPVWSGQLHKQPVDIIRARYPRSHRSPFVYRKLCVDLSAPDSDAPVAVFWSYLPKMQRLAGVLSRDKRFVGRSEDEITKEMLHRYFTPVAEVREAVDAAFAHIEGPLIGVHLRFTDRKVPIAKILHRIDRMREAQPDAALFLATDSSEAQEAVLSRYERVHTLPKTLSQDGAALHFSQDEFADPVREARAALADMVALSRCDWLIHSRHSTFSVTAALMGDIPVERQFDVDRFNVKVVAKRWFQARA
ncbi:nodulation protein NodZ [Alteraurantiacibacter aquimixticola]|uniref:Nodulation protein Z n=1 Tax=Alteraurantiacibacter aquimixticola TaxID=2489173 RepID=A0A4V4U890_9SPHN|nr:nodulation protein NodZ [Alteraurantiacibacter aquimixticola]TIX48987.1 hypothetical protein E5222_14740 [Alteraurantiacibacter aquimixticola]